MAYLSEDYINFFNELEKNNNKEWFDLNRKRYEKSIKDPFKRLVGELILRINSDDPSIVLEPKNAIFRINRDIRFSKDKTPYKLFNSALINASGKKDKAYPGYYFEVRPDKINVYGGMYQLEKEKLQQVREFLSTNIDEYYDLVNNKDFKNTFGNILGEKNKRIPKEFQEFAKTNEVISNKQFYYTSEIDKKYITSDELLSVLMERYYIGKPVKEFLARAYLG